MSNVTINSEKGEFLEMKNHAGFVNLQVFEIVYNTRSRLMGKQLKI